MIRGEAMQTVLVFSNNENPWVSRMSIRGLARYAKLRKWNVELITRTEARREGKRLRELIRFLRPSGLIAGYTEGLVEAIPKNMPVAWMDAAARDVPETDPLIIHDARKSAELAAEEFLRLGLKRFAAVGDRPGYPWSRRRIDIFCACVRKAQPHAVVDVLEPDIPIADKVGYRRELEPWLRRLDFPCGVFAVCDRIGVNVLSAARNLGIAVPDELAVVGVDNDEDLCLVSSPPLTSIASDWEKGGFLVAEALDRRMQDPCSPPMREPFGDLGIVRRASTIPGSNRVDPRIVDASVFIREHACEGIGVAAVVKHMGCSRRLAELRYLQATGKSIFEEIRDAQFAQVLVLLAQRNVPIGVIADMCGWKSPLSLRRYFEKRMSMTMGEWRKSNRA